ncbi:L,D-transpeptidase family protein [Flavobacterium polysaccharolyticum]|uniref:L,D-transpeptidase family protein n=1 Tax=Flavobacterium polysaccharolyticum TaxID=3133148 RepID=A0ABU9NN98_9FLAO
MKHLYFVLFLLLVLSCQKKANDDSAVLIKTKPIPKIQVEANAIEFDSALVVLYENQRLLEFYRATGFKTVWQSASNRKVILNAIKESDKEGLFPENYQLKSLTSFEKKHPVLKEKELVTYDLLLTLNTQLFLTHLKTGKLNAKEIYSNWDIEINPFDVNTVLAEAFTKKEMAFVVNECKPNAFVYNQLKVALQQIEEYPDVDFTPIAFTEKIVANDTNVKVIAVKKRLKYWKDFNSSDSLTAIYDEKTVAAVKRFQERHGLAPDGVLGVGTIEALNFSKANRKKQIIANLERWRWFQIIPDTDYVIINIPDYKLTVVENQDTTITQKVVVGTVKRRTPVLTSYLRTVVLNPTWTIPPTILKEDVVPAMKRNRNYLSNKNILIYDSNNNVVAPENWNPAKPHNYRYVQEPGPNNTLGEMKILFPNHHSIYLHDTNHRNLFGLHNRSLSSGCIRVEKPLELAGYFLNHSEKWSKGKIDSVVGTRKTHYVKIEKKYNIYIWYWTAWSQKGELHFRKDIYDYDLALYDKLRS